MNLFGWLRNKERVVVQYVGAQGSAFVRHARHETEVADAHAKIAALDALQAATTPVLELLEKEATRVHQSQDNIDARRAAILAKL